MNQQIQQMQNQALLKKEIMHRFFENLAKLAEELDLPERLKDALRR